ncbi:MAG: O-antigen ligase family protein [Erysipelotrichaceae bacterium]|nr:O-antigen ligase family protein [Erysipelotrichaceae bacterium]
MFKKNNNLKLIGIWFVLPILVTIYCLAMGVAGGFEAQVKPHDMWCYYDEIDFYRNLFYGVGTITIIYSFIVLIKKNIKNLLNKKWILLLSTLLLWSFLCTALSEFPAQQFLGTFIVCDGLFTYVVYAAIFILGLTVSSKIDKKKVIIGYCLVICLMSVLMLLQETRLDFIVYCFPTIKAMVFFNLNYFGYVLCLSAISLLGLYLFDNDSKYKLLYLLGFAFELLTLLVNNTFGSYLAVCVAMAFLYFIYYKKYGKFKKEFIYPLAIWFTFSFVNFVFFNNDILRLLFDIKSIVIKEAYAGKAGSGRWTLWLDAVERIKAKPVFGWGPEGFIDIGSEVMSRSPHNDILQIAGYLGIPGVILYVSAFVLLAIHMFTHLKDLDEIDIVLGGVVVCYLASAELGHPMFNTTPYFWLFLGMMCSMHCGETTLVDRSEYKGFNKRFIMFLAYALICLIIAAFKQNNSNESLIEQSDYLAMHNADLRAQLLLKNSKLEDGKYYYDEKELDLVTTDKKVIGYGVGTTKIGGGLEECIKTYKVEYDYDETKDYNGMIVQVTIKDQKVYKVEWIEAN